MMESDWQERGSSKARLVVVWVVTVVAALILSGRLFYWQVLRHAELQDIGQRWQLVNAPIPALRGEIMDRHGFPLALDEYEFEIYATPRDIGDPEGLATDLAPVLGMDRGTLVALLSRTDQPSVSLVWDAPLEVAREVEKIKEQWNTGAIGISAARRRSYPEKDLACHVLGFVTYDHEIDYDAFYGVEESYNSELRGQPGSWGGSAETLNVSVSIGSNSIVLPKDGQDVVLTLDRTIQKLTEDELKRTIDEWEAQRGTIIIMDPRSGAILAMANYPGYDPNPALGRPIDENQFFNPAVSEAYEPGSVFKVVTMAAALDSGIVGRYTTYYDQGQIFVGGLLIYNWDRNAYGTVSMTDLLRHSLNVGAATLSTNLGPERFYDYVRRFGFGQPTGIDLPYESKGLMRLPGDGNWRESDLGTNAFGQGIAVTPIQMITAVAAVANDGVLPKPYVVQRIEQDGRVIREHQPQHGPQVISPWVAEELTEMLIEICKGRDDLDVPGYTIAGKTGTAQIPVAGGYHPTDTIASFVAYAPARDPKFIVLIKIDRPAKSPWGTVVAVPAFQRIAQRLFVYLGIPPDDSTSAGA
jgi:cell division protein FtsI (penicillin-binding protein 3)